MGSEQLDQWGEFLSRLRLYFFPANPSSKNKSKARSPIGWENLGYWSSESLQKIIGRLDSHTKSAIQYLSFITLILTRTSKEFQCYSPSALTGD
ncbi:hypothetical protein TNCV_2775481 [Trichonephila clavipes]|nr:hypothetical protein TNCV_2775481 [Trichonephila clavipes]